MTMTIHQFKRMFPQIAEDKQTSYCFASMSVMNRFNISSHIRQAAFLSQIGHESRMLTVWEEDLWYRAERIMKVWPKRFPTLLVAQEYAENPEKLANKVYGGRKDLGNIYEGDGWKFRGRGPKQLTGRDNYTRFGAEFGIDTVNNPDLLLTPDVGFLAAGWFWNSNSLNSIADRQDIDKLTFEINGGRTGLAERKELFRKFKAVLEG